MPFGTYGHLADKYGVHWFVQGEKKDAQEPRSTFCRQPRPIPV